jgi:hypothetical protein
VAFSVVKTWLKIQDELYCAHLCVPYAGPVVTSNQAFFDKIKRAADPAALKNFLYGPASYGLSAVSALTASSLTRSLLHFTSGVSIQRIAVRRDSCRRI